MNTVTKYIYHIGWVKAFPEKFNSDHNDIYIYIIIVYSSL